MRGYLARLLWVALIAPLAGACIEPFEGSKIEVLFSSGVPVAGANARGAPPAGTHLELYAVKNESLFHLRNFQILPIVDPENPCFIETRGEFAGTDVSASGVHISQWYAASFELYNQDGRISADEAGYLADAAERVRELEQLRNGLKVVTATPYGPPFNDDFPASELDELEAALPPRTATDAAANRQRRQVCEDFFSKHPTFYVGNDRLITRPINGIFLGVVDGQDPRNGGFVGGASMDIEANLADFDSLRINWQFDDPDDPRAAALGSSDTGYHLMAGAPQRLARGIVNVRLVNENFPSISAQAAIFTNLGRDDSHF